MVDKIDIKKMLDEFADLSAEVDYLRLEMQAQLESIIPLELRQKMDEIEDFHESQIADRLEKMQSLEGEIKQLVVSHGESVRGDFIHAIYTKGKITWDNKGLSGYSAAHPEINAFKKVGEPSVSIRRVS